MGAAECSILLDKLDELTRALQELAELLREEIADRSDATNLFNNWDN